MLIIEISSALPLTEIYSVSRSIKYFACISTGRAVLNYVSSFYRLGS